MNKNHEGYTDYTACEAVRRANKTYRYKGRTEKPPKLTYRIAEVRAFQEVKAALYG